MFRQDVLVVAQLEVFDLVLGFVLRDAVRFLDLARQLHALAGNDIEVIVGELAPLRLYLNCFQLPSTIFQFISTPSVRNRLAK
jgi:hypothetical protein